MENSALYKMSFKDNMSLVAIWIMGMITISVISSDPLDIFDAFQVVITAIIVSIIMKKIGES